MCECSRAAGDIIIVSQADRAIAQGEIAMDTLAVVLIGMVTLVTVINPYGVLALVFELLGIHA